MVEANSIIVIYVSDGLEVQTTRVPNLIGKTEQEARNLITKNKLTVKEVKYTEDRTKENGVVVLQDIRENEEVTELTGITITVNKYEDEMVSGTIKIDLASYKDVDTGKDKTVTVRVQITSSGTTSRIYEKKWHRNKYK